MLDEPIITKETHFTYKYVIMQGNNVIQWEEGINRIADLEAMPEMTTKNMEFVQEQQAKVAKQLKNTTSRFSERLDDVNSIKNMVLYDEWETYTIKFQVYEPFEDPQMDVRIQGNRPEVDNKVMKRQPAQEYLTHKYGKKVRPFEVSIKFKQTPYIELSSNESEADRNPEGEVLFQGRHNRFEYCYSSKLFNSNDVVYEREPHRVIEI